MARPRALWLLLAAAAATVGGGDVIAEGYQPSPPIGPDGAFEDCPCVHSVVMQSQGIGERGSYCKPWNVGQGPTCNTTEVRPPTWCGASWCYVNPLTCGRSHTKSNKDAAVSYSYETCGDLGAAGDLGSHYVDWLSVPLTRRLNRPLYVWASGFRVETYDGTRPDMNLNMRATLTFAKLMLDRLGVDTLNASQLQYRQLSATAQKHFPYSQYTACVYDIALGNLDMCLGPVWDTDERRAMNVSFTGSIFVEEMSLLMPESEHKQSSLWSMFFKTFEPFSKGLWALIFCVIGLSCLAMVAFDHWFTPTASVASQPLSRSAWTTVTSWLHSFLAAEVTFMPATSGGKVFSVGYGFFVLVCISCYTANMATILIGEDLNPSRIDSIQDAIKFGRRVCYHAAMPITTVRLLYPGLEKFGVPVDGSKAGLGIWKESKCEVCVLSEMMMADEWADRKNCDWFLKRRPVMMVPNGFYSSNALAHEVSWMTSKLRLNGNWSRILHEVSRPSLCRGAEAGSASQLNASHMFGAIIVLVLCFIGGLLVHSYELSHEVDCCAITSDNEDSEGDSSEGGVADTEARILDLSSAEQRAKLEAASLPAVARVEAQLTAALRELQELRATQVVRKRQPLLRYLTLRR